MKSLFMEASAKTSVGVTETFKEVVVNILNSPDLWVTTSEREKSKASGVGATNSPMPGTILLEDASEGADPNAGGCYC